ncbi:MAG: hypothetical protein AB7R89_13625 [Dehalococcoidia bacterium]
MPSRHPAISETTEPIRVVYERPRPRIAKGLLVLLLGGPLALLIFAMGQTVWGALWRAWLTMIGLYVLVTVVL